MNKERRIDEKIFVWILYFVVLLSMFFLLPKAGDDWLFYARHAQGDLKEVWEKILLFYTKENGRFLGNLCACLFAHYDLAGNVFKAAVVWGITYFIWKVFPVKFKGSILVAFLAVLWLPGCGSMFAQTYAWSAGFYNYVTPALFLTGTFAFLIVIYEKETRNCFEFIVLGGILGFLGQLFAEFYTTQAVVLSVVIVFVYWRMNRKISCPLCVYMLATFVGAAFMFLSPSYMRVGKPEDQYRQVASSVSDLLEISASNYTEMSKCLFRYNYWIVVLLSIMCAILIWNGMVYKKYGEKVRNILLFYFASIPCYCVVSTQILPVQFMLNSILKICLDFCIVVSFFIMVMCVCINEIDDVVIKRRCVYLGVLFIVLIAPLFVVKPVGSRCFYMGYIVLVLLSFQILSYVINKRGVQVSSGVVIPLFVAMFFTIGSYLIIAFYQNKVDDEKCRYIEYAMQKREKIIEVPCFIFPEYIHEPETEKIGYEYFYEEPWDIEWKYIPYVDWYQKYNKFI